MPEQRFPTMEEFWRRLDVRRVEGDLRDELRARLDRGRQALRRLPDETTTAVVARLLPGTMPARALAWFVDEHFDRQLGRGDDRVGLVPRSELIPLGLELLEQQALTRHGQGFDDLPAAQQDDLLAAAERGDLPAPERFEWATWFRRFRALALLGLGSDPRGMVFMGFPGPSYRTGHVWLDDGEVVARVSRRPGYLQL